MGSRKSASKMKHHKSKQSKPQSQPKPEEQPNPEAQAAAERKQELLRTFSTLSLAYRNVEVLQTQEPIPEAPTTPITLIDHLYTIIPLMSSKILEINQETCIKHAETIDRALTAMEGQSYATQHSIIMVALKAQLGRSQKLWIVVRQFTAFNGGLDSIPGPSSDRAVRNPQQETARIYLRDFERREMQITIRALALLKDLIGEKQETLITRLLAMFEESRRETLSDRRPRVALSAESRKTRLIVVLRTAVARALEFLPSLSRDTRFAIVSSLLQIVKQTERKNVPVSPIYTEPPSLTLDQLKTIMEWGFTLLPDEHRMQGQAVSQFIDRMTAR